MLNVGALYSTGDMIGKLSYYVWNFRDRRLHPS